jgi:hypothetical protein
MKNIIIAIVIGVLIILGIGYYLISPAFQVSELDEESPLINDAFDSMSEDEKIEFNGEVDGMKNVNINMSDMIPSQANVLASGEFMPRAHEVEGKALLIDDNGKKILRFEDFETINGPNLHIYVSAELGDGDFIDLGEIKATKGNVNYELPENVDYEKYNKVLVWCVPFRVLFSYAELE